MKYKIFIDGSEGTTGLKINERFLSRDDIEILTVDSGKRKESDVRRRLINESDVTFLCLPDEAARESVSLAENDDVIIIDASTAHRTHNAWSYGFPELSEGHRERIAKGKRIAVPGCHAAGFISLIYPLVKEKVITADSLLTASSLSGYSGAGKSMIAEYENTSRVKDYDAPRLYALGQQHKHLPEIVKVCGLSREPVFSPVIADYFQGMVVSVPLHSDWLATGFSLSSLRDFYQEFYRNAKLIEVMPLFDEAGFGAFLCANGMAGRDDMRIYVAGSDERIVLYAQFDNLGKGASGAAVQCMNIALGLDEILGLNQYLL